NANAILAGMDQARQGGPQPTVQTAGLGSAGWAAPPAQPPSGVTPAGYNAFSFGPGMSDRSRWDTSNAMERADDEAVANFNTSRMPNEQALAKYGQGVETFPGAETLNQWRGFARGLLGRVGVTAFDSTKEFDELHKWLSQLTTSQPFAAGSDARLNAVISG